jgi:hypothetical protein
MIVTPFLFFGWTPAFALDYIINLKVNGKMTGRLQIGNVEGMS